MPNRRRHCRWSTEEKRSICWETRAPGVPVSEDRFERGEYQLGIDAAPERLADYPARPGIQDHGQKEEAAQDGDVGQVRQLAELALEASDLGLVGPRSSLIGP